MAAIELKIPERAPLLVALHPHCRCRALTRSAVESIYPQQSIFAILNCVAQF